MFCQCMMRCYGHEQDPGMALRCQSLVTYVHSSSVLLPCPARTSVMLGIHNIRLLGEPVLGEPAPALRFAGRASTHHRPPPSHVSARPRLRRSTSTAANRGLYLMLPEHEDTTLSDAFTFDTTANPFTGLGSCELSEPYPRGGRGKLNSRGPQMSQ